MRDGYVFVDRSHGVEGGMIRWYEEGGGNPQVLVLGREREDPCGYGISARTKVVDTVVCVSKNAQL